MKGDRVGWNEKDDPKMVKGYSKASCVTGEKRKRFNSVSIFNDPQICTKVSEKI